MLVTLKWWQVEDIGYIRQKHQCQSKLERFHSKLGKLKCPTCTALLRNDGIPIVWKILYWPKYSLYLSQYNMDLYDMVGYIDVGYGWWRRFVLMTILRCWWRFLSFWSPTSSISRLSKRRAQTSTGKRCHQDLNSVANILKLSPTVSYQHHNVTNNTMSPTWLWPIWSWTQKLSALLYI